MCDKNILVGLKWCFSFDYQSNLLYAIECWLIKKTQVQRLLVIDMRMIRYMHGYTRLDGIRNSDKVAVAPIEDKWVRLD